MKKTLNRFDHSCLTVQFWCYFGADSSITTAPFIQEPEISAGHIWQMQQLVDSNDYPDYICNEREIFNCSSWHLVELTATIELWESIGVGTANYLHELVF